MSIPLPQIPDDPRKVMRAIGADGTVQFAQIGIEEVSSKGRYGALTHSTSQNTIALGEQYFTIDHDPELFKVGDDVQLTASADVKCYQWAEIIGKDTVAEPARLRVFVEDISERTGQFSNWEIQVVARPKPGIEKDLSLGSIDPTTAGPWTIPVTAGKFFPIGGKLLLKPSSDPQIVLLALVEAFSGTDLTISKVVTNATVSTSYNSWKLALLDAPQQALGRFQVIGLKLTFSGTEITIQPGSIRSYDGTVNLVLQNAITKDLALPFAVGDGNGGYAKSANLAGQADPLGDAITGTGTAFLTDFGPATLPVEAYNDDLAEQSAPEAIRSGPRYPIFGIASGAKFVEDVSDNTHLSTLNAFGSEALQNYWRGGWPTGTAALGGAAVICLIRRDSDGLIDVCMSSFTPSGDPDLPSGFTKNRAVGAVQIDADVVYEFDQPILRRSTPDADLIDFKGQGGAGALPDSTVEEAIHELDDRTKPNTAEYLSSSPSIGIGYSTGAGGAVTQLTSKATAVTLNKITGLITTHNAALAANAEVSFTLNNSSIAAGDTVIAHRIGGGSGAYLIQAADAAAGSCVISIRNMTAGSLSQAFNIRFTVIKSVSA